MDNLFSVPRGSAAEVETIRSIHNSAVVHADFLSDVSSNIFRENDPRPPGFPRRSSVLAISRRCCRHNKPTLIITVSQVLIKMLYAPHDGSCMAFRRNVNFHSVKRIFNYSRVYAQQKTDKSFFPSLLLWVMLPSRLFIDRSLKLDK